MTKAELVAVIEHSARRLLQVSSPPVRYWLLTQVMGRDEEDRLLLQTIEECRDYPPKLKLPAKLREDGTWPIPKQRKLAEDQWLGPPYGYTYVAMLRNLCALLQYRTSRDEEHVDAALERILGWQTRKGYIPGPWTDAFPLPHYNGFALHNLLRFGLEQDDRFQKLVRWLLGMQRADGGWNIPYLMDVYYLRSMKLTHLSHEGWRRSLPASSIRLAALSRAPWRSGLHRRLESPWNSRRPGSAMWPPERKRQ